MEKIQELRQDRIAGIEFIKNFYNNVDADKMPLYLEKYLLQLLSSKNSENKLEAMALEADMFKHIIAYNAYNGVNIEKDADVVEYTLKYRSLDYREISVLLYSFLNAHGNYSTSLLLRDNKEILSGLVKAYVNNELLSKRNQDIYNERQMSFDTKNALGQIELNYNNAINSLSRKIEEEKNNSSKQLQFKFSLNN